MTNPELFLSVVIIFFFPGVGGGGYKSGSKDTASCRFSKKHANGYRFFSRTNGTIQNINHTKQVPTDY